MVTFFSIIFEMQRKWGCWNVHQTDINYGIIEQLTMLVEVRQYVILLLELSVLVEMWHVILLLLLILSVQVETLLLSNGPLEDNWY